MLADSLLEGSLPGQNRVILLVQSGTYNASSQDFWQKFAHFFLPNFGENSKYG